MKFLIFSFIFNMLAVPYDVDVNVDSLYSAYNTTSDPSKKEADAKFKGKRILVKGKFGNIQDQKDKFTLIALYNSDLNLKALAILEEPFNQDLYKEHKDILLLCIGDGQADNWPLLRKCKIFKGDF